MKDRGLTESELIKFEINASFENAIDQSFRRVLETARAVWERKFAGQEASDACVSVRIAATNATPKPQPTRASDFVKSPGSLGGNKAKLSLHFVP